jgi:hypothetical protein
MDLADRYRRLITSGPDLTVWEAARDVIETAASLRAHAAATRRSSVFNNDPEKHRIDEARWRH